MTTAEAVKATQTTADNGEAEAAEKKAASAGRRKKIIAVVVVLALVAVIVWRIFFAVPSLPPGVIAVSGRVEGDDSAIAAKTSGRILQVTVREGDTVNAGDVIATLDDAQIKAREQAAQATLQEAEAKGNAALQQIAVLQQQLSESQLQVGQSKFDTEGHMGQAQADLAAAQAELAQQQAALQIAAFDKDAYTRLAKTGAVSERQGVQAAATADQQSAVVAAAQRRVEAAQAEVTTARATLANPGIRTAAVAAVRSQIAQQNAEVAAAMAETEAAQAQLASALADRQDLVIRAPFSGTVVTRSAEPGEVINAGTAVITLLDLTQVYLRGFIPEAEIGKVKVGQQARVYLDSDPQKPLAAFVQRIDPQATFTPENTYFRDDRVKQVVGVKLQLKEGFGFAKPGMPADGEVLVSGDKWPKARHR
jgi:HlyD family secretion protein